MSRTGFMFYALFGFSVLLSMLAHWLLEEAVRTNNRLYANLGTVSVGFLVGVWSTFGLWVVLR